jgi:hypothetical protein
MIGAPENSSGRYFVTFFASHKSGVGNDCGLPAIHFLVTTKRHFAGAPFYSK